MPVRRPPCVKKPLVQSLSRSFVFPPHARSLPLPFLLRAEGGAPPASRDLLDVYLEAIESEYPQGHTFSTWSSVHLGHILCIYSSKTYTCVHAILVRTHSIGPVSLPFSPAFPAFSRRGFIPLERIHLPQFERHFHGGLRHHRHHH